jgi:glucose-6-phosphate 1-dehydrogenase
VRAFYFSVAPSLFGPLADRLHATASPTHGAGSWWRSPSAATSPRPRAEPTLAAHFARSRSTGSTTTSGRDGPEPHGRALRQPPLRASVEQPLRGPHPVTVAETVGRRGAGWLLRQVGAMRDMVRTTSCSSSASSPWSPLALRGGRGARREAEGHPRAQPLPPTTSCAASTTAARGGPQPRGAGNERSFNRVLHRPQFASPTGAGRACLSTCARQKFCARGAPRIAVVFKDPASFHLRGRRGAPTATSCRSASSPTRAST